MLWNARFEFGIESIDAQHKQLFSMIEQAQELIKDLDAGIDCYDDIMAILSQLENYTVEHFEHEELMLEEAGYGALQEHANTHNMFVDKVHAALDSDFDENQSGTLHGIIDFLLQWVSDHILVDDVKYVPVLKGQSQFSS